MAGRRASLAHISFPKKGCPDALAWGALCITRGELERRPANKGVLQLSPLLTSGGRACHFPLRWQRPSALARHKVSPSPDAPRERARLSGSPGWGEGWGLGLELARRTPRPSRLPFTHLGPRPAASASAPRPPVHAASQLAFPFSYFCILRSWGQSPSLSVLTPGTPEI